MCILLATGINGDVLARCGIKIVKIVGERDILRLGLEKKLEAREPARARSGSARLGEAREPKRARAEPNSTARYTNEPSRAGSVQTTATITCQLSVCLLVSSHLDPVTSVLFWSQLTRN